MSFNIQLYIAINNNITSVINTNSIGCTIGGNIQIAINSQLSIIIGNSHALQTIRIKHFTTFIGQVHFYGISFNRQGITIINFNTRAAHRCILNIKGQCFARCIYFCVIHQINAILVISNLSILSKFIYSVLINYIFIGTIKH